MREQVQGHAAASRATGTTDTVHVGIGLQRQLVADHGREILDVQSARGDVGGDQHAGAAVGEAHEHLVALALLDVAVQAEHRESARRELPFDVLRVVLRVAEHQRGFRAADAQQMRQRVETARRIGFEEDLLDLGCRRSGVHRDLERLLLQPAADLANLVGKGRREEQGLPRGRRLRHDGAAGLLEVRTEHAVRFVEHQHAQVAELQRALLDVLAHAPGHADDDVRIMFERGELGSLRDAAAEHRQLNVGQAARETADLRGDLVGEFARRAEH